MTANDSELRSDLSQGTVVGLTVATVDGDHITLAELVSGVEDYRATYLPDGQQLTNADRNALAGMILQQLIDRTLLVQEAKRRLLTTEQKEKLFNEHVEAQWNEQEIPKLCRKYKASNVFELQRTLEAKGRSLELMRETFRKATLAREYLQMQLQPRMLSSVPPQTLTAYYQDHLDDFQRRARITWREILVKASGSSTRAEARSKAEDLLDQLRRGADFATLAQTSGQGPTASKGGLWETEPGASIVPAINEALERLPLRQVSTILEGPQGYHIVRVEERRPAGPRPFSEVQGEIIKTLQQETFQRETEAFIKKLRERALITSRFDGTESAPAAHRDGGTRRASHTTP